MKILELNQLENLPDGVDMECIDLCQTLNRLPETKTFESCMGHNAHPYWVFFHCKSVDVLTRLGRAVSHNYSDGNWEIVVDSTDTSPYGCFWLRTKTVLPYDELMESVNKLIDNILYWFKDEFDEHFSINK